MNSKEDEADSKGLPDLPDEDEPSAFDTIQQKEKYGSSFFPDPPSQDATELPSMREDQSTQNTPPPLSSFPDADTNLDTLPVFHNDEIEAKSPIEVSDYDPLPSLPSTKNEVSPEIPSRKPRSTYVKLTKFHTARKSLDIVMQKVSEIDTLLESINSVKKQEAHELLQWTREIEQIKARLNLISSEIFESREDE